MNLVQYREGTEEMEWADDLIERGVYTWYSLAVIVVGMLIDTIQCDL